MNGFGTGAGLMDARRRISYCNRARSVRIVETRYFFLDALTRFRYKSGTIGRGTSGPRGQGMAARRRKMRSARETQKIFVPPTYEERTPDLTNHAVRALSLRRHIHHHGSRAKRHYPRTRFPVSPLPEPIVIVTTHVRTLPRMLIAVEDVIHTAIHPYSPRIGIDRSDDNTMRHASQTARQIIYG